MAYYVDTNIFLNIVYKEPRVYEKSRKFLEEIHAGNITAITSSVTLLELKLDLAESGYPEIAEKAVSLIEDVKNLEIVPLDKTMTKLAADHVLKDKLTIHDAYHLSTAICQRAETFITRDEELAKKIIKYITVKIPEEVPQQH
ncbi:MAG: PIN domain-containing protein [Candidatus Bathyarchaeia archaeon]